MVTVSVLNLTPRKVDLLGIRADSRNAIRVTITSSGQTLPLAGYTISAQARAYPAATEVLSAAIEDIDEDAGAFTLRWPGAEVHSILLGDADLFEGYWDMQIASGELDPSTFCAGRFQAISDVTR